LFLKDLLRGTDVKFDSETGKIDVAGLDYNSQRIEPDFLFVAIKGFTTDGHKYIINAIENGATVIIVEKSWFDKKKLKYLEYGSKKIPILVSKDNRVLLSKISANFYKHPSKKLKVIGVTGTNGKTTITYLLESILKAKNQKVGVIGTINYRIGDEIFPAPATTPESLEINKLLAQMLEEKVKYVIMEVSSHSLELHRVDDIQFDYAVFTNLTEDHFDFHKNYTNYFKAKKRLFNLLNKSSKKKKTGIINIDDKYGKRLFNEFKKKINVKSYSLNGKADLVAQDIKLGVNGTNFILRYNRKLTRMSLNLIGRFNVYNALAAIGVAVAENIGINTVKKGLSNLKSVPGRLQIINAGDFYVGIDYAHTDDALKNVLQTIEELNVEKIITVFGAGGDRDKDKRQKMGRVAALLSDVVIITSDNPRTEKPSAIISEIEKGVLAIRNDNYFKIVNRKKAIKKAVKLAEKDSFVLIAGKGHEDYQIIGTKKKHFSDFEIVKKLL